jgi:hypothetical protein
MSSHNARTCKCPPDSPFHWQTAVDSRSFTPVELRARHSAAASVTVDAKRAEGQDYGQIAGLSKNSEAYMDRMQGNFAPKRTRRAKTKAA